MHIKKLTKSECVKIIDHDYRRHLHYRNEKVDLSKKDKNVIFKECKYADIKKYIKDNNIYIYGRNGKNADKINYLCSVIVHYPKDCEMDENQFFKTMNDVLTKRFGNCIGSIVHYDEERPHLHFLFMPTVKCKNKKNEDIVKLCAKDVVNREMLRSFHNDIENDFKKLGYNVKLQNEEAERGFKNIDDIEEYKKYKDLIKSLETEKQTLQDEKESLQNKNAELEKQNQSLKDDYVSLNQKHIEIIDEYDILQKQTTQMKNENQKLINDNKQLKNEIVEQQNFFQNLLLKIQKCMDFLKKAEKKDIERIGFSPISNDISELQKEFVDIMR